MDGKKRSIHTETPLIFSTKLSALTGEQVYLKLENTQSSGAFKLRGNGFHSQMVNNTNVLF
jgi:threonine dehydratase